MTGVRRAEERGGKMGRGRNMGFLMTRKRKARANR